MTAEIAIINRNAVTLATDSAVTLTVRGVEKIYNAADKLFELCELDPIGIMIYNNLDFMGVALEVAIKGFRRKNATVSYGSVFEAAVAFFNYLATDSATAPDAELEREHVAALLHTTVGKIRATFDRAVSREAQKEGRLVDDAALLTRTVQRSVANLEACEPSDCFRDLSDSDLLRVYQDVADDAIAYYFDQTALAQSHRQLLRQACALSLHRDSYSEFSTGFVFAGFGADELSPSLVAYEIDGVVSGRLKKRLTDQVQTNRRNVTGEILPFAQREMVDRFLYGIDPRFEAGIERFLGFQMDLVGKLIADSLSAISQEKGKFIANIVSAANEAVLKGWRLRIVPAVKSRFMREIQDMIAFMPKQELAALAKELVNLTSVKRRFSSERESVGGPIDVALISRNEGFVWVQRKHYFDPGSNPRYFYRNYSSHRA